MSQTININGSFSLVGNNIQRNTSTITVAYTCSGSNYQGQSANITTGSWQTLNQGSNADFRFGLFQNFDLTSSIYLGVGGTGSYSILQPQDTNILTFSGSTTLYAKTVGTNNVAILNYIVSES